MEVNIHPGQVPGYVHKKICTRILIAAFCNRKVGNKYSGVRERIGKLHIHTVKYYSAVKMNGLEFSCVNRDIAKIIMFDKNME